MKLNMATSVPEELFSLSYHDAVKYSIIALAEKLKTFGAVAEKASMDDLRSLDVLVKQLQEKLECILDSICSQNESKPPVITSPKDTLNSSRKIDHETSSATETWEQQSLREDSATVIGKPPRKKPFADHEGKCDAIAVEEAECSPLEEAASARDVWAALAAAPALLAAPSGPRAVLAAAAAGNASVLSALLSAGADPNAVRPDGRSALLVAVESAHYEEEGPSGSLPECASLLLQYGARPLGALDGAGARAVEAAVTESASGGPPAKLGALLTAGAAPHSSRSIPLLGAAARGRVACVRALLAAGADPNALGPFMTGALHFAAERGHVDCVRALLAAPGIHFEKSQFENNHKDGLIKLKPNAIPTLFNVPNPPHRIDPPQRKSLYKNRFTITASSAVIDKVQSGTSERSQSSLDELQNLVSNIGGYDHQNSGTTPTQQQPHFGDFQKNVNVSQGNYEDGATPLHLAAENEHFLIMELLVEAGADVNERYDDQGTALHRAVVDNRSDTVEKLLQLGADVEIKNCYERSPLHEAKNHPEILEKLLAVVKKRTDRSLHLNCKYKFMSLVNTLQMKSVKSNRKEDINTAGVCSPSRNYNESNIFQTIAPSSGKKTLHTVQTKCTSSNSEPDRMNLSNVQNENERNSAVLSHSDTMGCKESLKDDSLNSPSPISLSPLLTCALKGDMVSLQRMGKSCLMEDRTYHGDTALHVAVAGGHRETVQYLLSALSVDIRGHNLRTPLHVAASYDHVELVHDLLDAGAHIDATDSTKSSPLSVAACQGSDRALVSLLKRGANVYVQDRDGSTPLHLASKHGRTEAVKVLMHYKDILNKIDSEGNSALLVAVDWITIVILLLDGGSDVNLRNKHGDTALIRAMKQEQWHVVRFLLSRGADPTLSSKDGSSPPFLVASLGLVDILDTICDVAGDNLNMDAYNSSGDTLLTLAITLNQWSIVSHLLQRGSSALKPGKHYLAPLILAIQHSAPIEVIEQLILLGGGSHILDSKKALQYARDAPTLRLLFKACPEVSKSKEAGDALRRFCESGILDGVTFLLQNGVDVMSTDHAGKSALHCASSKGHLEIVELLTSCGADPNVRTKLSETPLHCAANGGHVLVVSVLLSSGAKHSVKTANSLTPLHLAAKGGHTEVVRVLLERGADLKPKSDRGLTPFHMAGSNDVKEILRMRRNCLGLPF